jgi:hypothetical protein
MGQSPIDFFANVTSRYNELPAHRVRCKLLLPHKYAGPIRFKFYPTGEQQAVIEKMPEFSVDGEVKDMSDRVIQRISANRVFWRNDEHESASWYPDRAEWVMAAEPINLLVTDCLTTDPSISLDKVEGRFWLTPSNLLSHARMDEPLRDGGFRVKTIYQPTFHLADGFPLIFREQYYSYRNEEGDRVTFSEPVMEFALEETAFRINGAELHSLISDFLVLISFAGRQRCMCIGWDMRQGLSHKSYYRRDIVIPSPEGRRSWHDGIIDLADSEEFMKVAQASFNQLEQKESVRRALNYAIPTKGKTLESEFTSLYASLESLLSFFRDKEHFEILSVEDFATLEADLKKWLKNNPLLEHNSEKRRLIYEKIRELNRISFSAVFKRFCIQYSVDLSDLWPVMGKAEDWPLSEIRNKLVHGATFSYRQDGVLDCATENLKWAVERMLLAILHWPVERTRVRAEYLSRVMMMHKQWRDKRELLKNS